MALHVTQIDKHKFVCGLFWQALSRPRELAKEAKDLARKIDFDMMVLRIDHTAAQAGFAHSRDGARKGLSSLAAVVSKALAVEGAYYDGDKQPVHNWLGAFKLPDGHWVYFAVRDASFLPNGDFAGTKEEVLDRLHSDYGLGGWNAVIGDEELADYGFHNFNVRSIETLIPRKKDGSVKSHKWWGLRQVDNKQSYRAAAVAAAVALLVGAGVMGWQHYQRQREEKEREAAMEEMRRTLLAKGAQADFLQPWAAKPAPAELIRACTTGLRHLTPGGWQLEGYECTASQAIHVWSRAGSTPAFLLEQVPGAQIELGGERASLAQPVATTPGKAEALLEERRLIPAVQSALQLMQVGFRLAPQAVVTEAQGATASRPPWRTIALSVKARGVAPGTVAEVLSRPGVRIDKLSYRDGEWSYEGVMYAK
ncbi:MAG TPA: type 4b pilus protein PilO2 [Noviherbaspirillum sp.]|jgi:hypothetical protein|uniref:type 4b pilus protein PilO2 n=1 Tax=Noviherbaspirillum sp. TaxID=1926288 RepID=UPI002F9408CE